MSQLESQAKRMESLEKAVCAQLREQAGKMESRAKQMDLLGKAVVAQLREQAGKMESHFKVQHAKMESLERVMNGMQSSMNTTNWLLRTLLVLVGLAMTAGLLTAFAPWLS